MSPKQLLIITAFVAPFTAHGDLTMPHIFGDHMVLQREKPIPIWGTAVPGTTIKVTFNNANVDAKPGDDGKWRVDLPAMEAGGPFELTVSGDGEKKFSDVLVGEVWLCSGQSNMEWTVSGVVDAQKEIAAAKYPKIRHIGVPKKTASAPQSDQEMNWAVCSPETAGGFTAVGYFFARELDGELDVPIGLINASWGGTRIEPWVPGEAFSTVERLRDIADLVATGEPLAERGDPHQQPTTLYNGMISPVVPYAIRGALWYQGEANRNEGMLYADKTVALVNGWRKAWGYDFPYYYVQIAPYLYGEEAPGMLANFWEAQTAALRIPQTGMAVINDIGNINDIHPTNKQEVGRRLALLALKNDYGKKDLVANGPSFSEMKVDGAGVVLKMKNAGSGLASRDGQPLNWFEIYDPEQGWFPAKAEIIGTDTIRVTGDGVKSAIAARFAWSKIAVPNLMNKEGLPAWPFRTDDVPLPDTLNRNVPEAADYQLVYDIDLSKLSAPPAYSVNRSGEIKGKIDKIAYYLELQHNGQPLEYLFVSMDPFTEDLGKSGIPTTTTFQMPVTGLKVLTNHPGIPAGEITAGNIEFWPTNYGSENSLQISGASNDVFDFGDAPRADGNYGSMQVHATGSGITLFSVNNWVAGEGADIGIGNSQGKNPDWSFDNNAGTYSVKRLRVFAKIAK